MTKRGFIRTVSYSVTVLVVIMAVATVSLVQRHTYKVQLESTYQQSLAELDECLNSIETNLTKSYYANSAGTLGTIGTDIYTETQSAKQALARLPVSQMNLAGTYKFLSQTGDYSAYLAKKAASDQTISGDDRTSVQQLLKYAEAFSNNVDALVSLCNRGLEITQGSVALRDEVDVSQLSTSFTESEETFKDYPTLLYDGPYADAVLQKEPEMIKDKRAYSDAEALTRAAEFLGVEEDVLYYDGEENGAIDSYIFKTNKYTVAVTKYGGYLNYILYSETIPAGSLGEEEAVKKAKAFLEKAGYENMQESYYAINDNICLVNFNYAEENGVLYYADLIKVGVAMDTGNVVRFEANGYLTNHCTRTLQPGSVTQAQAQRNLSTDLQVQNVKSCVIPKENGTEAPCYEFHCKSKTTQDEVLVYVNTQTGQEEDIKLLLYSDEGTLVK